MNWPSKCKVIFEWTLRLAGSDPDKECLTIHQMKKLSTTLSIPDLISLGESETVEFKTSIGREAVETIVAFTNTQGGTLLAGVKDDGRVCGITTSKETLNQWLEQIKSTTSPAIIPDITAHDISGRTVVAIQISEYPVKPVNTRGRYLKYMISS